MKNYRHNIPAKRSYQIELGERGGAFKWRVTLAASGPSQDSAVSRPVCLWPFPAVGRCLHHSGPLPTRMGFCLLSWHPSHVRNPSLHIYVYIYNRTWEVPKLWLTCVSRSQFSSLSSTGSHVRRLVAFR